MKRIHLFILIGIVMASCHPFSHAYEITVNGQASGWGAVNHDEWQLGLRYIPEMRFSHPLAEGKDVDADIAINAATRAPVDSLEEADDHADVTLYRSWLRYATAQMELRLGLQKINFGPAKILRSLMWFDHLDPRDPLKLTDGVYGMLGRYYFLNNANIWIWGLYENDDLKGLEVFRTDEDKVEFGGRCQFPMSKGEMAVSFHRRYLDKLAWNNRVMADPNFKISDVMSDGIENRLALDGNWDIGIGMWFEASASEIRINEDSSLWQEFLTIGGDYTFDMGPGIHVLFEHFMKTAGAEFGQQDNIIRSSALSIDFSVGMLDNLQIIEYYDWKEGKTYGFLGWQRTYDNWLIHVSLFSSPKDDAGLYGGDGFQCLVTYNH